MGNLALSAQVSKAERDDDCRPQGFSLPACDVRGVRMITSKLTSKAQTTIPQAVRTALGVKPGDEIAYAITDGQVLLTKAAKPRRGAPFEDPFAFFREWDAPEDDEAFGDL